jgi:hypothetical protein
MHHDLARELKEAGFPNIGDVQHRQGRTFLSPDGTERIYSLGDEAPTDNWFVPTLSELIEACGEVDLHLQHFVGADWGASGGPEVGHGPTAEEAVARLWLAINKSAVQ